MKLYIYLFLLPFLISCNRVADNLYSKDFYTNQQDNNFLYNELSVDSTELVDYLSLKSLIDSLELEINGQLDFLDSIDSNYSPKTIIKGDKNIISSFYNDGVTEKEILLLLYKIDKKLSILNENYDQKNFNFLPTDTLLMYDKMPLELLKSLFEITISAIRDAEKETLTKKIKK